MKRIISILMCVMLLFQTGYPVIAQSHRHTLRNDSTEKAIVSKGNSLKPDLGEKEDKAVENTGNYISGIVEANLDELGENLETFDEFEGQDSIYEGDRPGKFLSESVYLAMIVFFSIFFAPVLLVAIILFYLYKRKQQRDKVAIAAINKGVEIPVEYREHRNEATTSARKGDTPVIHHGINKICIGLGLCALAWFIDLRVLLGVGCMVIFIGIGQVIIGAISDEKKPAEATPKYTRSVDIKDEVVNVSKESEQNNEKSE